MQITSKPRTQSGRNFAFLTRIFNFRPANVGSRASGSGQNCDSESPLEVWIEPVSENGRSQSLLSPRKIEADHFVIGRRGALTSHYDNSSVDYLVSEHQPYAVSKRQCELERSEHGVVVRDLGSRNGTWVDDVHLGGAGREAVELGAGEHSLILGPKKGGFRFKLTIA